MDKRLFQEVIGEVPPSTVSVETVITRGRRAERFRRATSPVVAAGVTVVLLSGAIAYTLTDGDGDGTPPGGQPTSPTETTTEIPTETTTWPSMPSMPSTTTGP
ncbi:hypothetical protein [Actinophytocola sediminis]